MIASMKVTSEISLVLVELADAYFRKDSKLPFSSFFDANFLVQSNELDEDQACFSLFLSLTLALERRQELPSSK